MQMVALMEIFPEVRERYQRRFKYIHVDEYQDTNHAQYRLVNVLAAAHRNLCVVGDDDQSVYSWRWGGICNHLDFARDYPGPKGGKLISGKHTSALHSRHSLLDDSFVAQSH